MAMPWGMALWMANMVWVALIGWVSSCLTVADELASSLRTGDIGFLTARAQRWVYEVVPMPQVLGEDLALGQSLMFHFGLCDHIHRRGDYSAEFGALNPLQLCYECLQVPNRDCIRNSDIARSNLLITRLSREGNINDARQVFDKMHERDVVTWTAVISGYIKCGLIVEARRLFDRVDAIKDVVTWTAMLSGVEEARRRFDEMPKRDVISWTTMVMGLARSGRVDEARKVFDRMPERNVVSWNAMVTGYAKNMRLDEAFGLFEKMPERNLSSWNTMITGDLAGLGEGQQVHLLISKSVYQDRTFVASALLNMYSKCGELSIARKIFDDVVIGQRDLVLWNGMIAAYAHHGCGMEAIELFEDMQGLGFKPNDVSYVELLNACSHAGLVDKGLNYFDELRRDNSIQLREDHHACLVDLCGRAGRLREAYDFIKQLGTKASSSIWGGLLAGCNAHGDLEIGQLTAKELEKEDPENAGTYLLLSNIYASGRKWREASRVRLKMKEKGLKKQPGCSWIEVGNRVHVFLARDKSHYQSNLIYSLVHDIHAEMKKAEHVPNNDFVDEEDFSSLR
ncbi:hypothetical protein Peur_070667 [Populus x canadensis]